jgi:hypothetical protein
VTGDWVARIARGLIHQSTFALVVEPAIADLQFETPARSPHVRLWGYSAVWIALAGGLWHDLVWDHRRPVWAETASVIVTLTCLVASYHMAMLLLVLGFDRRVTVSMGSVGRLVAHMVGAWSVPAFFLVFVLAALLVAASEHETGNPDRSGV